MMKNLLTVSALAAAVGASAPAWSLGFNFDVNGDTAGGGGIFLNTFDWRPDNILFDGAVPIPLTTDVPDTISFDLKMQGSIGPQAPTFLDTGAELTYVAIIPTTAQILSTGSGIDLLFQGPSGPGSFDIFYGDTCTGGLGTTGGICANQFTGLGYGDGRLIASGTTGGIVGISSATIGTAVLGLLDQFGPDNLGGVTTVGLSGSATWELEWDFMDENFFLDVTDPNDPVEMKDPNGADATHSADSVTPFSQAQPSPVVAGATVDYGGDGVNDNLCAVSPCDLHGESDTRTGFRVDNPPTVPEPASLGLLGAGLLLLGARRRRNAA